MQKRRFGMQRSSRLLWSWLFISCDLVRRRGSIHEIIAAMCRAGGEEVVPPGQNHDKGVPFWQR